MTAVNFLDDTRLRGLEGFGLRVFEGYCEGRIYRAGLPVFGSMLNSGKWPAILRLLRGSCGTCTILLSGSDLSSWMERGSLIDIGSTAFDV